MSSYLPGCPVDDDDDDVSVLTKPVLLPFFSSVSPWVRQVVMKVAMSAAVKQPSCWRTRPRRRRPRPNWALPLLDQAGLKLAAPAVCRSASSRWFWWSSERKFDPRRKGGSSDWSELLRKMEVRAWMTVMMGKEPCRAHVFVCIDPAKTNMPIKHSWAFLSLMMEV